MITRVKNSLGVSCYSFYVLKRRAFVEKRIGKLVANDRHHLVFTFHAPGVGLFAHLNWMVWIAAILSKTKTTFEFRSTSPNYSDSGMDWVSALFDQPEVSRAGRSVRKISIHGWEDTPFHRVGEIFDDFQAAHETQARYLRVGSGIEAYVDGFARDRFGGEDFVSCHYRGTDKASESPRINYEVMADSIRCMIEEKKVNHLFVASDETAFVQFVEERFPEVNVVSHDCERSVDGEKIHGRAAGQNERRAREALIDCLLLSRGVSLLKTASMLSGWSKVFNPELEVELLSELYEDANWFPDRLFPVPMSAR